MTTLPFTPLPPAPSPPRNPAQVAAEAAIAEAVAAHVPPLLEALREHRAALGGEERLAEAIRHTIARLEALSAREFPAPPAPVTASDVGGAKAKAIRAEAQRRVEQMLAAWCAAAGRPVADYPTNALASVSVGVAITHQMLTALAAPPEVRASVALTPEQEGLRLSLAATQAANEAIRHTEAQALAALDALIEAGDVEAIAAFQVLWPS